jgi:hypothetical protein
MNAQQRENLTSCQIELGMGKTANKKSSEEQFHTVQCTDVSPLQYRSTWGQTQAKSPKVFAKRPHNA